MGKNKINGMRRINTIVAAIQILKRLTSSKSPGGVPADVPPGHVAVSVGSECKRFTVRVSHLNHPVFANLLDDSRRDEEEEKYDCKCSHGPLHIPCEEAEFREALRVVTRSAEFPPSRCRVATESVPLLHASDSLLC